VGGTFRENGLFVLRDRFCCCLAST